MEIGQPRKIFIVTIRDKEYDVYDIEGKEHYGYNDTPKTWWLYFSDKLPEGMLPPNDSPHFVPMTGSIERRNWSLKFTQGTSTKEKWGETRFSSYTYCEMICNNKLVYAFGTTGGTRGMDFAMAKAKYLEVVLSEHCYNFFEPEKENGRKICWYGLPATIRVQSDTWEIAIMPDYTAGLNEVEWWEELKRRETNYTEQSEQDKEIDEMHKEESRSDGYINWGDAIEDGHIYWFRK